MIDPRVERLARVICEYSLGAKPGELPLEQPTKYDFVINLKAAQALSLTVPPSVLAQAADL